MKRSFRRAVSLVLSTTMLITSVWAIPTNAAENNTDSAIEYASVDTVQLIASSPWLESAYVKWNAYAGATGYNVYYKAENDVQYTKIDDELVRVYPSYYRADVLGLKAGNYTIKVAPIVNGAELAEAASETGVLAVEPHTREGFAFSQSSPNKTASGGYNDDGTVPENAQILYITDRTKDTVTLDVIKDSKGSLQTCTGIVEIMSIRKKGYDKTPLIVRYIGTVTPPTGVNGSGYLEVKGCFNVTMEGVGEDAVVSEWSFLVRDANNVEIRNFGVMWFQDDGISLDTDNYNIWIHNNDIFYGNRGSDPDQAKGDGSLDVKKSEYVTISYNHFWDSGKSSLAGMGENNLMVTYHHNWFDHSDSRHPRVRVGTVHVYNNYYDGVSKYGIGATTGCSIFVESNYFRNCKYPMLMSQQGSDIYDGGTYGGKGTFSGEAGGMIKSFDNYMVGQQRFVDQNTTTDTASGQLQVDAYTVTARNEEVPSTFKTVKGGTSYSNFDTASTMYSYTPDSYEVAKEKAMKYAGRVDGGDFDWTFTAADDTLYDINEGLYNALKAYTPSVNLDGTTPVVTETTTEVPTETSTEVPTETSTEVPTETSTEVPTETSTEVPTETSTEVPTETTTEEPTETTTEEPTETTTEEPTEASTEEPTEASTEEPTEVSTSEPVVGLYGDADGDGQLTATDAAMALQYVLNKDAVNISAQSLILIEVDGDGIITATDSAFILQKTLDSSFKFAVENDKPVETTTEEPTETTTEEPTETTTEEPTETTTVVDTTIEDTTIEDTTAEDTTIEDTTVEDTTVEDTTVEDTTVEPTTAEDTTSVDTTTEETTVNEHLIEYVDFADGVVGNRFATIENKVGSEPYYYYTTTGVNDPTLATNFVDYYTYNGVTVARVSDSSDTNTSTFVVPLDKYKTGVVTLTTVLTSTISAGNWTVMQVYGDRTVNGVTTDSEIAGVRVSKAKTYALRVNGDSNTLKDTGVAMSPNTATILQLTFDMDNKTVTVTANGTTSEPLTFDGDDISSFKFVTATKTSRELYIEQMAVTSGLASEAGIGSNGNGSGGSGVTGLELAEIYVTPDATDGDGTQASPMNIFDSVNNLAAGGTIHLAEGTYDMSARLMAVTGNNGTAEAPKSIIGDGKVVLDFTNVVITNTSNPPRGVHINGDYWVVKNIEVCNAADNGFFVAGSNNVIENCVAHSCKDTGFQIARSGSKVTAESWPKNNLIKNCTSYNNADLGGEDADGFAAKLTCGEGNVFEGCIAYNNLDDGWDLYAKSETGPIGVVTIKNCISFRNGKTLDGSSDGNADMNGFKLGGEGIGSAHIVENCIAFENGSHGFTDNNNPSLASITNCTSFDNAQSDKNKSNFAMDRATSGLNISNCISYVTTSRAGSVQPDKFTSANIANSVFFHKDGGGRYYFVDAANGVNYGDKSGTMVSGADMLSANDFVSIALPAQGEDVHTTWRNADGSINIGSLFQPTAGGRLDGKGANFYN